MQTKDNGFFSKNSLIAIAIGVAVAIFSTGVFAALFSLIITLIDNGLSNLSVFSTLSLMFGCLLGGAAAALVYKSKGFLYGLAVGGIVYMILLACSLAVNQSTITISALFNAIICLLSGAVAGIITVNQKQKNKYKIKNR